MACGGTTWLCQRDHLDQRWCGASLKEAHYAPIISQQVCLHQIDPRLPRRDRIVNPVTSTLAIAYRMVPTSLAGMDIVGVQPD